MKTRGGVYVRLHSFLTSALDSGQLHVTDIHWPEGWVGPTDGLDVSEDISNAPARKLTPSPASPQPSHYTDYSTPAPTDDT
jgi:hypothetical protein